MFFPRALYQEGVRQLELGDYSRAVKLFSQSEKKMPEFGWFSDADWFRLYTHHGQAMYHIGRAQLKISSPSSVMPQFEKAKQYLEKADKILPYSYRNSYWLTLNEDILERIFFWRFPKRNNPYNAAVLYQKTLALRPAGTSIRYTYLKYLHRKGRTDKIPEMIENLIEIAPSYYLRLKEAPFFDPKYMPYVESGLQKAEKKNMLKSTALEVLARIYEEEGDLKKAISYYKKVMEQSSTLETAEANSHLASLYLREGDRENSFFHFAEALTASGNPESALQDIYGTFRKTGDFEGFLKFLDFTEARGGALKDMTVMRARCLLGMGEVSKAEKLLKEYAEQNSNAKAFHLLSQIYVKNKNWPQMEIFAQKAFDLEPDDPGYLRSLKRALVYQRKYFRAEEVISKRISVSSQPLDWLYNERAEIKWRQKHYKPALADWKQAFDINPRNSSYAYNIALGYERLGQPDKALVYIRNALELAPGTRQYQKAETRIKKRAQ